MTNIQTVFYCSQGAFGSAGLDDWSLEFLWSLDGGAWGFEKDALKSLSPLSRSAQWPRVQNNGHHFGGGNFIVRLHDRADDTGRSHFAGTHVGQPSFIRLGVTGFRGKTRRASR